MRSTVKTGVGVRRRGMRVVGASFAAEVAATSPFRRLAVFAAKALVAGPRLQQGAIDGEVVVREQTTALSHLHDLMEELVSDGSLEQTVAILGEDSGCPDGIVHRQADEPAKEAREAT
jgi:hypothetical protein